MSITREEIVTQLQEWNDNSLISSIEAWCFPVLSEQRNYTLLDLFNDGYSRTPPPADVCCQSTCPILQHRFPVRQERWCV